MQLRCTTQTRRNDYPSSPSGTTRKINTAPTLACSVLLRCSALGVAIAVAGYTVDRGEESIRAAIPIALDIALGETG